RCASSSWKRISSASSGESSMKRTLTLASRLMARSGIGSTFDIRRGVDHGPELAQGLDRPEELVDVHRLDHVGVHAQVPAPGQVALLARGREDHHRQAPQLVVGADPLQHLQPAQPRPLDGRQQRGRVRVGAVGEPAGALQVFHRLHAVLHVDDRIGEVGLAQGVDRHLGVGCAVFGQQDGTDGTHAMTLPGSAESCGGRTKWKVARLPGSDSAQMRPPWRASTRSTLARPMPVPGYSLALCSRWSTPNSLPAWAMSKPTPLSRTVKWWPPSGVGSQPTSITAGSLWAEYLTALPSRLSHSCRIMFSSATTIGNGAIRHSIRCSGRPVSSASTMRLVSSTALASSARDCMSAACSLSALRPRREYTSRSSISEDMRRAELLITSR